MSPASVPPPAPRPHAAAEDKLGAPKFGRWEDEPESGGWDNADTATSFPEPSELPEPTPRVLPSVVPTPPPAVAREAASPPTQGSPETGMPPTPNSPGTMRGPYPTAPGVGAPTAMPAVATAPRAGGTASHAIAATAGLGSAMREEVWAIVRAAVEEAVGPLVARQRELEARLERAEREPARAPQTAPQGSGTSAAARLAQIAGPAAVAPAPLGPALLPAVFKPVDSATNLDLAPSLPPRGAGASAHPAGPRPSIGPYGVSVIPGPRVALDLDAVGPVNIDGFDGGRRKKIVARVVVVLMLLLIGGAITMMVLSYN